MKTFLVRPAACAKGEIYLLGDKSIAHRAVILSAISLGKTVIVNFPVNVDCFSTINILKKLGVKIICNTSRNNKNIGIITVFGVGLYGFKKTNSPIFIGDSGTTLRVLLGVLAGQDFKVKLVAGSSLSKRPMLRVTAPLRMMGADIKARRRIVSEGRRFDEYPPITIHGGNLKAISYKIPVPSAQVKSAILLAGLYAKGLTRVFESLKTRDHTERMLKLFKAKIEIKHNEIIIKGDNELITPKRISIPGDISSASFFIVLAAILPNSHIVIKNVGLNPLRLGLVRVLKRMNVDIKLLHHRYNLTGSEPAGDIIVRYSKLKGVIIKAKESPSLIDELPILMVAACFSKSRTILEGVRELRVKETDRVRSMTENLAKMGANIKAVKSSGFEKIVIEGKGALHGAKVKSYGDHRTAMSMVIAGLNSEGSTIIDDVNCISKSFPNFLDIIKGIARY